MAMTHGGEDKTMTKPARQAPVPWRHAKGAIGRMSVGARMLTAYVGFFALALLSFGSMVLLSFLP